jgi:hypothetical protein
MKHRATIEAVLRTVARVRALRALISDEELAKILSEHYKPGEIAGLGDLFEGAAGAMLKQAPRLQCSACGKNLRHGFFEPNRGAKYCDAACRQKAYRERVTDRLAVPPLCTVPARQA